MYVYRRGRYSLFWCVVFRVISGVVRGGFVGSREGVCHVGQLPCLVTRLHVGVAHFKSKIQTRSSEDCKNVSEELLLTVSKRPLGGGASRGEAKGSHSHTLKTRTKRVLLAPPTVYHNLWKVAVANNLLADTSL